MALDATVGGAAANSYLSVAVADAYAAADLGPAVVKWLAAELERKEAALMRATTEVDAAILSSGLVRYSGSQALLYPRSIDVVSAVAFVPTAIARATYAQAKYLNSNIEVMDAALTRQARGMQSASEPNISYSQTAAGGDHLSDEARAYLRGAFSGAARISSVIVGTDYSYPVVGEFATELLP